MSLYNEKDDKDKLYYFLIHFNLNITDKYLTLNRNPTDNYLLCIMNYKLYLINTNTNLKYKLDYIKYKNLFLNYFLNDKTDNFKYKIIMSENYIPIYFYIKKTYIYDIINNYTYNLENTITDYSFNLIFTQSFNDLNCVYYYKHLNNFNYLVKIADNIILEENNYIYKNL